MLEVDDKSLEPAASAVDPVCVFEQHDEAEHRLVTFLAAFNHEHDVVEETQLGIPLSEPVDELCRLQLLLVSRVSEILVFKQRPQLIRHKYRHVLFANLHAKVLQNLIHNFGGYLAFVVLIF